MYKAFHKGYHNWTNYLAFADWWNFENFRSEDYLKEEIQGKKLISIVEQAYIAYSKKLLEGEPVDSFGQKRVVDKDKIKEFLPKLDKIIGDHPEYQYPSYFKAKLLLALGDDENILSSFLPFAKQKRNDFWVWELMAEIFSEDKDIQFACYCKALSLKTPEEFLVKIRKNFARLLVKRQMYNEAKTEIQKVIETIEKNEWNKPNQIVQWSKQEWYKTANEKKDNYDLYIQHVKKAEEILFQDIPEEIIVVEFVNENKKILNFVKNKRKFGFFKYLGYIKTPQIGDLLKVRFNGEGKDGLYKILTAQKADSNVTSNAIKDFEGTIKIISPQHFGFIENIFIDPKIIEENMLNDGQKVKGRAMLSFNKKKNDWGWKAIKINS
jgi:tetratricopeptide (TPR) repeat protein